jgi:hypothetical protein
MAKILAATCLSTLFLQLVAARLPLAAGDALDSTILKHRREAEKREVRS